MAFLGLDFVISSLIWLFSLTLFIFLFRKQLKRFFYKKTSFDIFLRNLDDYLNTTYPKITFDLSIIDTTKQEANPTTRKYLIVDNIIDQYTKLNLDKNRYPNSTDKKLQWSSYIFNCEPNKDKLPNDWIQRKNALLIRDSKRCFRCSKEININTIDIHMIRDLSQGGKYFLENLLPVCKDCYKILNNDNKKIKYFDIKENLYNIVKNNNI